MDAVASQWRGPPGGACVARRPFHSGERASGGPAVISGLTDGVRLDFWSYGGVGVTRRRRDRVLPPTSCAVSVRPEYQSCDGLGRLSDGLWHHVLVDFLRYGD